MIEDIVKQLVSERDRLNQAIAALGGEGGNGRQNGSPRKSPKPLRKRMAAWTPERRQAHAKRMKLLWKKKGAATFNK